MAIQHATFIHFHPCSTPMIDSKSVHVGADGNNSTRIWVIWVNPVTHISWLKSKETKEAPDCGCFSSSTSFAAPKPMHLWTTRCHPSTNPNALARLVIVFIFCRCGSVASVSKPKWLNDSMTQHKCPNHSSKAAQSSWQWPWHHSYQWSRSWGGQHTQRFPKSSY